MQYVPPINGDVGDPNRSYVNANVSIGLQGSIPPAESVEHPMREIVNVIEDAGLVPDSEDLTQLSQAIDIKIAASIPNINVISGYSDLLISTTGTSSIISITAKEIALSNGSGSYVAITNFSASVNCATSGKNGLSTGVLAASTGYYIYAGFDGDTGCAWIDPSPSAPTIPPSITHYKRIGWISMDASVNKYPLHFQQKNEVAQLITSSAGNVQQFPTLASGAMGSITTPTMLPISVVHKIPTTAQKIALVCSRISTSMIVHPNQNCGPAGSLTNPPIYSNQTNDYEGKMVEFMLEGSSFYYASNGAQASACLAGWTDTL